MLINETENNGLARSYNVIIKSDDIEQELTKEIAKIQATASLPGFRKGKAPLKIVRNKYEDQVMPDIVSKLVDRSFAKICNDNKVSPATKPKVDFNEFKNGNDLSFSIKFEIFPDFDAIDYSKITVDTYKVKLAESDIDEVINDLRKNMRQPTEAPKNHKIADGDVAVIDFTGKLNGVEFPGGKGHDHELKIGSKQFIEGFESQLIGHKKGDEVLVKVKFPENYHSEDLKGQNAEFDVVVKDVLVYGELPELNEEFFAKIGNNIKTHEDLKDKIKLYKEKEFSQTSYTLSKKDLFDKLVDSMNVDVPPSLLEEELVEVKKMNPNDSDEENLKIAKRRVILSLYFIKIADQENLQVSQTELRNAVVDQARAYPGMEMQVIEMYSKNQMLMDQIRNAILEDKVVAYILDKVNKNELEISPKEFAEKI